MLDVDATVALLSERPRETAILVDYDGSLSPIVEHPEDAVPLPAVAEALRGLVGVMGCVGVVSGRPLYFLLDALPIPGLAYAGLYGLEIALDGKPEVDPQVLPFLPAIAEAAEAAESEYRSSPVHVERKAGICLTLHYRQAEDRRDEVNAFADELADRLGLAAVRSRKAVELRPPVAVDKGTAVDALIGGLAVGAFAGDDTGDLPAFEALTRAVADSRLEHAVRIGVSSPEAPPELAAAVDTVVDGPTGLLALLDGVLARTSPAS
ncbi:MAG: trehalose-phosphatase [Acidimicrobiia bacterium]|jgi:trehalose 6-phosphate phosphatase